MTPEWAYLVEDPRNEPVVALTLDAAKRVLDARYGRLAWDDIDADDGYWYADPSMGQIVRIEVVH